MTIGVWDYVREYEAEQDEIHTAITRVLKSGTLILGNHVKEFEAAFAEYCGCRFGVGVANGTDAIFLALKALGIGSGDEVITVSNTAIPTVSAIVSAGATPVFVDIEPSTYLMDTDRLESVLTERTRCVIPVHLYGQCVAMEKVNKFATQHGLKVVEDCAQSHGAERNGARAGSMSDLSTFSFYPTKILGGFGDAGMVLTDDEDLRKRLLRLRHYGMDGRYYAEEHGYNSRIDELHAAVLLGKLAHLEEYLRQRRRIAERYRAALSTAPLALPRTLAGNLHAHYLFVCRHPARDRILTALKKQDIHLNVSYRWPVHLMTAYRRLGYSQGDLPHTEAAADEIFSLPMYPTLTRDLQETVIRSLLEVVEGVDGSIRG